MPDRAAYSALLASCTLTSFVLTPWGRTCSMVLGWAANGHPPIVIALDHGEVRVTHRSDRRVDAWFGGSAADLLLASYGRLGTLASLRTLRLRGRRPYRSLLTAERSSRLNEPEVRPQLEGTWACVHHGG